MGPPMALPIALPERGSRLILRDLHRELRVAVLETPGEAIGL
jgi:hypothetical protein